MPTVKDMNGPLSPLPGRLGNSLFVRALSAGYGAATSLRNTLFDRVPALSRPAPRPVISVGGLRAGGTGKTPLALCIGRYLLSKGCAVAFLSRGYRRADKRPRLVGPGEPVAWEAVGDEPWLLHRALPQAWLGIGADRCLSARRLAALLPQRAAFVLDDGFQHRALRRDLDIVCLHERAFDDRLAPAGFLRETLDGLGRAHAAVIVGAPGSAEKIERTQSLISARFNALPCIVMAQEPGRWVNTATGASAPVPPLENPWLVCGIARPDRFISFVRSSGISPSGELIFPDHHHYRTNDFNKTRELYSKGIITTEKDAVRLLNLGIVPERALWHLSIELQFAGDNEKKRLWALIDKTIS